MSELRKSNKRICHMLMLLNKAPRTRDELSQITGIGRQSIGRWLADMEAEGLVSSEPMPRAERVHGTMPRIWKWEGA